MLIGERIKTLRVQKAITQKELSDIIGVSVITIRNWEAGNKLPSANAVISLARAFGVSSDIILGLESHANLFAMPTTRRESALLTSYRSLDKHGKKAVDTICAIEKARVDESALGFKIPQEISTRSQKARYIPLYLTPSAAGYSAPLDGDEYEMLLIGDSVPRNADFAVRIQGDSMAPYINDGDIVFVEKASELSIGDVGIFSIDGAMYCKLYFVDQNRNMTLVSTNPECKDSNVYVSADSASTAVCFGRVLLDQQIEIPDYFKH